MNDHRTPSDGAGASAPPPAAPPSPAAFDDRLAELERHRSVDVERRLTLARAIEQEAAAAGDVDAQMRARLLVGDMLHRVGELPDAVRLAVEVSAWAGSNGATALLARSHLVLSTIFEGIGDVTAALDHAVLGIDVLGDPTPTRERGRHLLRLADSLALHGSTDEARRRYDEAESVFALVGERELQLIVLNNLAVLAYESGDPVAAGEAAARLAGAVGPGEMNADFADTIARACLVAGDLVGAERAARQAIQLLDEHGDSTAIAPAEMALTHAEVLLAAGRTDEAQLALDGCLAVCEARSLAGVFVGAMSVQAELFAACGDFRSAYLAHREFHRLSDALRSQQHAAAVRTRQAQFEVAEARREAERFWQQARVDPLTDLHNRRFVDETLPRLIAEMSADSSLVVAIVDIDHFKSINDDHSHEVGDDVLRRIAALLADGMAVPPGRHIGFAARLGGEEFLVVESSDDAGHAAARVERLRTAISELDWSGVAAGLRVTASAGVAICRPGDTQRSLLARADDHLYRAKLDGRDRSVTEVEFART